MPTNSLILAQQIMDYYRAGTIETVEAMEQLGLIFPAKAVKETTPVQPDRMRHLDADKEARRRWGVGSIAVRRRGRLWKPFEVGRLPHTPGEYGYGDSWEEAFADADERKKDVMMETEEIAQ